MLTYTYTRYRDVNFIITFLPTQPKSQELLCSAALRKKRVVTGVYSPLPASGTCLVFGGLIYRGWGSASPQLVDFHRIYFCAFSFFTPFATELRHRKQAKESYTARSHSETSADKRRQQEFTAATLYSDANVLFNQILNF